ncbi:MAG: phosphate/phosphite/phosphonate ABC transporter substrate-binding protein [Marinobacterium sp.]
MKPGRHVLAGLLMLVSLHAAAEACKRPEVLRFAAIPKKAQQQQYEEFEPMRLHLQQRLGIPVTTVVTHSYQAVIEGVLSGAVDLAELGPAAYLKAKARDPGIRAVAAYSFVGGEFTQEGSYYNSVLLVSADSDLKRLEQLRGRAVALTDPDSTSGALIPQTRFRQDTGMSLDRLASPLVYAGSHDRALAALQRGQVDAAFVSSRRADDYIQRGDATAGEWRELWRSPPIHYDPLTLNSQLCPDVVEMLKAALLTPSPARNQLLQQKQALGIEPVSDADYAWLKELM